MSLMQTPASKLLNHSPAVEAFPRVKRWTKAEFIDAVENHGMFKGTDVLLWRGELVEQRASEWTEPLAPGMSPPPRVKPWTKAEYFAAAGFFDKSPSTRICLFRGELIEMPPIGRMRSLGVTQVTRWLVAEFMPADRVRIQLPFETPGQTVPQPDAAVVTPEQNGREPHPNVAKLIVEVSDSTVAFDRDKAVEYAAARVPDYWLLNIPNQTLEVFRQPTADASSTTGFRYADLRTYGDADSIAPLAKPEVEVAVSFLFDRRG